MVQTTATLNWPQAGQMNSVTAPLITFTPVTMSVTVPCDVIRSMPPEGGMVLGTAPDEGKQAALNALFVNVSSRRVDVTDRNVVIASVPREQGGLRRLRAHRDHLVRGGHVRARSSGSTGADGGQSAATGNDKPSCAPASPIRTCGPRSSGVFTDLSGACAAGTFAVGDDRHPVHHQADRTEADRDGARRHRGHVVALLALWRPRPARRPTDAPADPVALAHVQRRRRSSWSAGSCVWHVIGANSSDDGYILQMARVGRPRRLHVELLPLVRQPRGSVRLVLPTCWR